MHNSLSILASGLAIGAAIYLKPIEKTEKFAAVPMGEQMLAIVDKGAVRLCIITGQSNATGGLFEEAGIQHALGFICGHAYVTNDHVVNVTSRTGKLTGYDEPSTN